MKRVWTEVSVAEAADGFAIRLDGKPMRLPGGPVLHLPHRPLAEAIAEEWREAGKGGTLSLDELPLTRLAGTAQERTTLDPAATVAALAAYAESDLLCYRAEAPEALVRRQAEAWQPWLDWSALHLDAKLVVTTGIMPVSQPPSSIAAMARALAGFDAFTLTGLGIVIPSLGSAVLGMAVARGALAMEAAHELAIIDERHQEALWGVDEEALARRAAVRGDLLVAGRLVELVRE